MTKYKLKVNVDKKGAVKNMALKKERKPSEILKTTQGKLSHKENKQEKRKENPVKRKKEMKEIEISAFGNKETKVKGKGNAKADQKIGRVDKIPPMDNEEDKRRMLNEESYVRQQINKTTPNEPKDHDNYLNKFSDLTNISVVSKAGEKLNPVYENVQTNSTNIGVEIEAACGENSSMAVNVSNLEPSTVENPEGIIPYKDKELEENMLSSDEKNGTGNKFDESSDMTNITTPTAKETNIVKENINNEVKNEGADEGNSFDTVNESFEKPDHKSQSKTPSFIEVNLSQKSKSSDRLKKGLLQNTEDTIGSLIEPSQVVERADDLESRHSQSTIADFFAAESEDAVVPEANLSEESQPFEE